jgi:hypothetical protein
MATIPRSFGLRTAGLLLALLALAVQLGAASVVPWTGAGRLDRLLAASICHADGATGPAPAQQHHAPDCALCPFCQAIAHASVLLGPAALVFAALAAPPPRIAAPPPARAPPARLAAATSARGPPGPI